MLKHLFEKLILLLKNKRCDKYGLKSLDAIINNFDVKAGILTLNELNRYIFKYAYHFYLWFIPRFFKNYYHNIVNFEDGMPIKRISISQANYLFLIGYLSYTIYDNIVTQNYYIPIKVSIYIMIEICCVITINNVIFIY